ncbi:MAG: DUF3737 family protein [Candidatus Aenigmatarchaeota archaeon]
MLDQLIRKAHSAKSIKDVKKLAEGVVYSPELEGELYRELINMPVYDKQQKQFLGLLVGKFYGSDVADVFDIDYFGFGSDGLKLLGKNLRSDNILSCSSNALIAGCKFEGDYICERSRHAYVRNSKFLGEDVFRGSKNVVIENSESLGHDFGRHSKNMIFIDGVLRGDHALSHIRGLKVVNSEFYGHNNFCTSEHIAAFCPYINCIVNPKGGIIIAKRLDYVEINEEIFDPSNTKIFAVDYPGNKYTNIIKIKKSDVAGKWDSENLEERLIYICRKYNVKIPDFLCETRMKL